MRTTCIVLTGALLLAPARVARAQQTAPDVPVSPKAGQIDFGVRGTDLTGDSARYQRFRDWRDGGFLDRLRLSRERGDWIFSVEAGNVGYRDQRYAASVDKIGRLRTAFEWNEVPFFMNAGSRWLYTNEGNGVLRIADSIQQGIQAGTLTLANAAAAANQFDLRSRRDIGRFDLVYNASPALDVIVGVNSARRQGSSLLSVNFGNSPGNMLASEIGAPLDDRTTDVTAALEFANSRGMVNIGYTGSWYRNQIDTLVFDNPLRSTDIAAGPSQGRMPWWPANTSVSFQANGSYKLPAKSRATASISIGRLTQNETLIPATINTALVAPALERTTAEAEADVVSMVYGFTSRPHRSVWLNAKYRYYDYNNKTALFATVPVISDYSVGTGLWHNEPASVRRRTFDADASYSPHRYLGVDLGYTREDGDRTHRIFERTAEDTVRVSVDSTGNEFFTVRAKYEYSTRTGSHFEEALLEEVGEQPEMRHFDIADRTRRRVTGVLTVTPVPILGFNVSAAAGRDDYHDSGFGLRDNENRAYTIGMDLVPVDAVSLSLTYGYERYAALQRSRTASPLPSVQFLDPTRDWTIDSNDLVRTFGASLDLIDLFPKTEIRVGFDRSRSKAQYMYGIAANATIPVPAALPPITNDLQSGRVDVRYLLRRNVAVGFGYWYEDYAVDDFAFSPATIDRMDLPLALYSGYLYRPYTAHTGWVRLTYLW